MGERLQYETICRAFAGLSESCEAVHLGSLGKSLCAREIPLITLGQGKHRVFYVATHHGSEWICAGLLLRFARDYADAFEKGKTVCSIDAHYLFHTRTICLVPILNPDGMILAQNGCDPENPLARAVLAASGEAPSRYRGNARGIDLNRNYDAAFGMQDCGALGPGMYPESEPETAALCAFLRKNAPFDLLLSLHTAGEEIYGSESPAASQKENTVGAVLARLCGYKLCASPSSCRGGGLKDWYEPAFHAPAFTIECGSGETPLPPESLGALYERLRCALFTAAVLS